MTNKDTWQNYHSVDRNWINFCVHKIWLDTRVVKYFMVGNGKKSKMNMQWWCLSTGLGALGSDTGLWLSPSFEVYEYEWFGSISQLNFFLFFTSFYFNYARVENKSRNGRESDSDSICIISTKQFVKNGSYLLLFFLLFWRDKKNVAVMKGENCEKFRLKGKNENALSSNEIVTCRFITNHFPWQYMTN